MKEITRNKNTFSLQYIGVGRNFDGKSQVHRKRKCDNGQVPTTHFEVNKKMWTRNLCLKKFYTRLHFYADFFLKLSEIF